MQILYFYLDNEREVHVTLQRSCIDNKVKADFVNHALLYFVCFKVTKL